MIGKVDLRKTGELVNETEIVASNGLVWYAGQKTRPVWENNRYVKKLCWYLSHDNLSHWWSVRSYSEMIEVIERESAEYNN